MRPPLAKYFEKYPLPSSLIANAIAGVATGVWVSRSPDVSLALAVGTATFVFVVGTFATMAQIRWRLRRRNEKDARRTAS